MPLLQLGLYHDFFFLLSQFILKKGGNSSSTWMFPHSLYINDLITLRDPINNEIFYILRSMKPIIILLLLLISLLLLFVIIFVVI